MKRRMFLCRKHLHAVLGAFFMAFLLCACDTPGTVPSSAIPSPTGSGASQLVSGTAVAEATPAAQVQVTRGTAVAQSLAPTNTPSTPHAPAMFAPKDTATSFVTPTSFTRTSTYTGCPSDIRSGGGGRIWTDCEHGTFGNNDVLIKAGFDARTPPTGCSEEGMYEINTRPTGTDKWANTYFQGGGCGPKHIERVEGSYIGFNMAAVNLPDVIAGATPFPTSTIASTFKRTAIPTLQAGFVACYPDMRAGGSARTNNNCWQGQIGKYDTFISSGLEKYMGGGKGSDENCDTMGFYEFEAELANARFGDDLSRFGERNYAGCGGPLHIRSVSGNTVNLDGSAKLSVNILSFIEATIQSDHWSKGVVGCPPDIDAGSPLRTSTGCWQGLSDDGYDAFASVGKEEGRPIVDGGPACSTQGFLYFEAWAPDSEASIESSIPPIGWHVVYSRRLYFRCSALRIIDAGGNSFYMEDGDHQPLSINVPPYLSTPTPAP